jgi:hypothetical protein
VIYCNLKGGLGNMMFQIAAMNNFSNKSGIDCSFPNFYTHITFLKNDKIHNQNCQYASEYANFIKNISHNIDAIPQYYVTFPFEFIDFTEIRDGMMFEGFFQSEKYFIQSRRSVLELFSTNLVNLEKYKDIDLGRTCSIHVRRGDYLKFSDSHPVLQKDYYINAVKLLDDKIDNLMIFSDDTAWCRQNFNDEDFNKKIFYSKEDRDYLEISLMSKCAHNIIANSSFSWWGAWLNQNLNKTVIAPRLWFGKSLQHTSTADLIPAEWIML